MFVLRYYNVFNVEQTTLDVPIEEPKRQIETIAACVAVLDDWQQKPQLRLDNRFENKAAYSPTQGRYPDARDRAFSLRRALLRDSVS